MLPAAGEARVFGEMGKDGNKNDNNLAEKLMDIKSKQRDNEALKPEKLSLF